MKGATGARRSAVLLLLAASATTLSADVVDKAANGFTVRTVVSVAAPPAQVYQALGRIGEWWESAHTFSGSATNLRLDTSAGGCFCERLANGGSVQHGVVVNADPGKLLVIRGALGPLQQLGADGSLSWAIAPSGTGSTLTVTYAVGGYAPGGLDALAPIVDQVIATQVKRLAAGFDRR